MGTPFKVKVVQDGNGVAVPLPSSLGLEPGEEVEVTIRRAGLGWPPGYFDLPPVAEDFMPPSRLPKED